MATQISRKALAWYFGKGRLFPPDKFKWLRESFLPSFSDLDDAAFLDVFDFAIVLLKMYFRVSITNAYADAEKKGSLFSVEHYHGVLHAKDLFRLVSRRPVGAAALQKARDEFEDIRDSLEDDAFGQDDGVPPHRVLAAGDGIAILNDWIAFIDLLLLGPEEDDDERPLKRQRIDAVAAALLRKYKGDMNLIAKAVSEGRY